MGRLLKLYNSIGRLGNIILLGLLILSGFFNRMFMVVKYRDIDYIIEIILVVSAAWLVFRIFKNNFLEIERNNIFKVLLISGIMLRIVFAVHDFYNRPVQESDYQKHEKLGYRIAFEHEFYDFTGVELRNFRQPGLPAIFAIGLWIYNDPVTFAIVMILFSFGVLIAGYYLFGDLKNTAALISFAYIALSPNMLFMASSSNTQLSFLFFLILLFISLKNYSGKTYQLIFIGALLAAEMYIRFNFLFILILIPFIMEKHSDQKISFSVGKLSLIFLSFLFLYSPWIYRNYLIYGTIRLMPSEGLRFYSSNVVKDFTKAGGYNGVPDSVINKYKNLPENEFSAALEKEAITFVENNPGLYIKGLPFRWIKYSGRQDWTIGYFFDYTKYDNAEILKIFFQNIDNFFFWIILFYPFVFLLRNKYYSPLSVYILWAYLSYSVILLSVSETRSRYNFPYILFPVFAIALIERQNKIPNK